MLSFVDRHRPGWRRLEALVDRCNGATGVSELTESQLREFGSLYRQAASHLAVARTREYDPDIVAYLNQLLGRAHGVMHGRRRRRRLRPGYFFGVEVPASFKQCRWYFLICLSVMVCCGTLAGIATSRDAGWAEVFMSPMFRQRLEQFMQEQETPGEYFGDTADVFGGWGFAGFLMTHNIKVALTCFALGPTFGLGTLYMLTVNSLMIGSFLGLGALNGKLLVMGAVVVPHGVIELSAILLASAAGLRFGYALINPGDLRRGDALMIAGHQSVRLAVGTIPVFVLAGLIEGLISPMEAGPLASNIARYAIGILAGLALYAWLLWGDVILRHRYPEAAHSDPDELFEAEG
ncbi:MAG TPA: hypothetical protein DGT21_04595 [Armatimonadetes bacterium]|nr:hypothetical protein [Armatimonadota bacterium]